MRISTEIGAIPLVLEVLRGFALRWSSREGSHTSQQKALEMLGLIMNHAASEQETKDDARRLQEKLSDELPADLVTAAMTRGQDADLETITHGIMANSPS